MLFISYEFLLFLVLVILGYYTLFRNHQWQFLLGAGLVFYYLADMAYLPYLLGVSLSVYVTAIRISDLYEGLKKQKGGLEKSAYKRLKEKIQKKQKKWLYLGLFICLILLGIPKYTNFFIYNLNLFRTEILGERKLAFADFLIPLGISFYTFKSLSYLIDVFRGKYRAERNFFRFALFVSFFPQLVQGPISRFDRLSESLFESHKFDGKAFVRGLYRLFWGYFKKLVIADRLTVAVLTITSEPDKYNGSFALLGMVFYSVRIYADFTGGIDITIAIAEMLGIKMEENFIRPYFSKSLKEYWRRWHITMGSWFTEYVFYPLSVSDGMLFLSRKSRKYLGKKVGKRVPVYLSTLTVWLLTGFWHGATWNFIVWGLFNGFFMLLSEELKDFYKLFHKKISIKTWKFRIYDILCIARTLFFVSSVRMLDLYPNVGLTFKAYLSIFTVNNWNLIGKAKLGLSLSQFIIVGLGAVFLFSVSLMSREGDIRDKILAKKEGYWYAGLSFLFLLILVFGVYGIGYDASQFIYHQY